MPLYGEEIAVTIASGGTKSSAVDLGLNADYMNIVIPTVDSCTINLEVSTDSAGTFQNLGSNITTETTPGAYTTTFRLGGWRHIKIETSAAQTSGAVIFYVRGIRM